MIVKKGLDLNSAISADAEIHLFRIFPRRGKTQSKGQPVTASENIHLHQVGKNGKTQKKSRWQAKVSQMAGEGKQMAGEKNCCPINKTGLEEMCRSQMGTHTICVGGPLNCRRNSYTSGWMTAGKNRCMLNLLKHKAAEQEVRKLKDHPGGSKTESASGKFRNSKIIREAQKTGRAFRKYRIWKIIRKIQNQK